MESGLRGSHGIAGAAMLLIAARLSAQSVPAAKPPRCVAPSPLDLRAPDIEDVLTPQQIADVLAPARARGTSKKLKSRACARRRRRTPDVWMAIAAPFWALLHPTQAWRIFAPIPPDRARWIGAERPDATSSQREPATGIPRMAGD